MERNQRGDRVEGEYRKDKAGFIHASMSKIRGLFNDF